MTEDPGLTVFERLLDRKLLGMEIGSRREDPLRDSIVSNLEMLLNTRRQADLVPAEYIEASTSVLNFGVPEFDQFGNLSAEAERNKLCKVLEATIRNFEPRLRRVSVRMIKSEQRESILRIRIQALIGPDGEEGVFEAGLKRRSGEISVTAGGSA